MQSKRKEGSDVKAGEELEADFGSADGALPPGVGLRAWEVHDVHGHDRVGI